MIFVVVFEHAVVLSLLFFVFFGLLLRGCYYVAAGSPLQRGQQGGGYPVQSPEDRQLGPEGGPREAARPPRDAQQAEARKCWCSFFCFFHGLAMLHQQSHVRVCLRVCLRVCVCVASQD